MNIADRSREDKSEIIINAAQKRFGLYGVEKTTMREIANDLHISKASLYYYFPDKENLYIEVIRREQREFLKLFKDDMKVISDPADCLKKYAIIRLSYFRKLLNLSRIRLGTFSELKPRTSDLIAGFREEEKKLILTILEKGKNEGKFMVVNTDRTAALFLDLLRGLRSSFMTDKDLLVIEDEEYEALSDKVTGITDIFIKGLMCK